MPALHKTLSACGPRYEAEIGFSSVSLKCGRRWRGRSAHLSFPAVVYVRVPAVRENFPDGGLLFSVGGGGLLPRRGRAAVSCSLLSHCGGIHVTGAGFSIASFLFLSPDLE